MNENTKESIQKIIVELDAAVPKEEGAQVRFLQYGGGYDKSRVMATQHGYLRLGIECLRAAFAPTSEASPIRIPVRLDYLLAPDSDIRFDSFERVSELPKLPTPSASPKRSYWFVIALSVVTFVAVVTCALVGFVTIIRWLGSL